MKELIRSTTVLAALTSFVMLTACANGNNSLTTGSVNASKVAAKAKANANTQCAALVAKIDALRADGTMARLEKVAAGTTRSAMIKRTAIAKATQLDRTYNEFRLKCTKYKPGVMAAKPLPAAAKVTLAKAAAKAVKPAVKTATVAAKNTATKVVKNAAKVTIKNATTSAVKKAATSAAAAAVVKNAATSAIQQ